MKSLLLAVDTNVLLDLADGVDAVLDAFALIEERIPHSDILVVPSVLEELAFLCDSGETDRLRQSAARAVSLVRRQERFRPLLELASPPGFIKEVANEIRFRRLLPEGEVQDSLILAEAVVLECALLLSSDQHLCGVDHEQLTLALRPFDLIAPVIASPREIARKFFR